MNYECRIGRRELKWKEVISQDEARLNFSLWRACSYKNSSGGTEREEN